MFGVRLLSGIVILAISILGMAVGGEVLCIGLCIISLIGFREMTKVLGVSGNDTEGGKKFSAPEIIGFVGIVALYAGVYAVYLTDSFVYMLGAVVFTILALMFAYVFAFPKFNAEKIIGAVFAFVYAPLMLSFVYLTREGNAGIYVVWLILISSWGCDTMAYVAGKLFGKHKAFPELSPKKTIEGCVGGVLGSALIGAIYASLVINGRVDITGSVWKIAVLTAAGALMSMVGDLAASAIKRNRDIKDYGKLIPGHGGIMDRFDSTIVVAPLVFFLTVVLL
ncbi:MAG: phosphatidate cytidylyltransferase [Lachnospiraceae bacterium]|nr:phosphatidate cytidylyltransferase [Lachnospiraceae bacterium]